MKKRSSKKSQSVADIAERYALAGSAGAAVLLAVGGLIMWAGGYVGLLAERADAYARDAAVDAGFEIRRVTLTGRREASSDDINAALGPIVGESLLHFDPGAARKRVESLGWVRSAAVARLLPGGVHVSIREREPAAVWQLSGALRLIDADGVVIKDIRADEHLGLPFVVGAGAPEAAAELLRALASHPDIAGRTSALVRVGERRWNMRLKNGVDVKLPEAGFAGALALLEGLQSANGTLDQSLEYIDVRDPERMTLRKRTLSRKADPR